MSNTRQRRRRARGNSSARQLATRLDIKAAQEPIETRLPDRVPSDFASVALKRLRETDNTPKVVKTYGASVLGLWASKGTALKADEFWEYSGVGEELEFFRTYTGSSGLLGYCCVSDVIPVLESDTPDETGLHKIGGLYTPARKEAAELIYENLTAVIGGPEQLAVQELDMLRVDRRQRKEVGSA